MAPVRLLTLNTGLFQVQLWGVTLFTPVPFVAERSGALAPALRALDVDVIALQELSHPSHVAALTHALRDRYPYVAVGADGKRTPHGLLLLSAFPIVQQQFHLYRASSLAERYALRKGFIHATIETPLGPIDLCNTHLVAGGIHHPESARAETIRQQQVAELLDATAHAPSDLTLIVGDLNAGPHASPSNYEAVLAAGYVDAIADQCPPETTQPVTWDPSNMLNANGPHRQCPPQRCDHVLLRATSRRVRAQASIVLQTPCVPLADGRVSTVSDHFGIRVTLSA